MRISKITSYIWLTIAVISALYKGAWTWLYSDVYSLKCPNFFANNFPSAVCNNIDFFSILCITGLVFLLANMLFSYCKAYIYIHEEYFISALFVIATITVYQIGDFSHLLGITLLSYAMLQYFTLARNHKLRDFFVFDMGIILGILFIVNVNFIYIGIFLFIFFIGYFDISFKQILQYFWGILFPFILFFPYLYFTGQSNWRENSLNALMSFHTDINLHFADFLLITTLVCLAVWQVLKLLSSAKTKPQSRSFIKFLFGYFLISLLFGLFKTNSNTSYILFALPPLYLLHSFAKIEKNYLLWGTFASVVLYGLFT